jgi:hypothetical protein
MSESLPLLGAHVSGTFIVRKVENVTIDKSCRFSWLGLCIERIMTSAVGSTPICGRYLIRTAAGDPNPDTQGHRCEGPVLGHSGHSGIDDKLAREASSNGCSFS